MKTIEEAEKAIQNLIDRMNRVEANTAHRLATMTSDLFATQHRCDEVVRLLAMLDQPKRQGLDK